MNTSKQRKLSRGAATDQSRGSRAARRPNRLLLAAAVVLAVTALGTPTAQAGVEFVTPIGSCTNKVDEIGDGKDLFIIAGNNVRFEVWGDAVNEATGFRVGVDSGSGTVTARVIKNRHASENSDRGCQHTDSADVEVDSPVDLNSDIQRSLYFRMPLLGDESRLQMRIKAYPTINVTWATTNVNCIVKTGTLEKLNQDQKIRIQLPAGHQQDQTTCNQRTLTMRVDITSNIGELDIHTPFRYRANGLPAFLQLNTPEVGPGANSGIPFTIDVAGIRALSAVSDSNIVISSPNPNRKSGTLNLEVIPDLGLGFSAAATCNPSSLTAGNPTDCRLTLPSRLTRSQPITWRITTASCFTQAVEEAPYDPNASFQVFNFPAGQSSANIRIRSADNSGCTDARSPINHVFEAWIGDFQADPQVTTVTSGPKYTRTNISLLKP